MIVVRLIFRNMLCVFTASALALCAVPGAAFALPDSAGVNAAVEESSEIQRPTSFGEDDPGVIDDTLNEGSISDDSEGYLDPSDLAPSEEAQKSEGAVEQDEEVVALEELAVPEDGITAFARRLYEHVLGREPDANGLAVQAGALRSGASAADIVWGFFGSAEFAKRQLSNDQIVDIAYLALFDRNPDSGGKATHKAMLDSGMSVRAVISSFTNSPEYRALCAKWGVKPGLLVVVENRDKNPSATAFVQRFYRVVFGRSADIGGLNTHTGTLVSGAGAAAVAWGFFGSPEFELKRLTNSQKVEAVYLALFDRNADQTGLRTHVSSLESGTSLRYVVAAFSQSQEYRALCSKWGVVPGVLVVVENRDKNPNTTAFVQRLYQKVFNRLGDADGLNTQTGYLQSGGNATDLAWAFFSSPEFSNRNLSNADKVEIAYLAMLDRASDPSGKADWLQKMDGGYTLRSLVTGFGNSEEFRRLCQSYGIKAMSLTGDAALDGIIDSIIARYGTDLRTLYDYVASYPYISGSKYPTGNWTPGFAKEMYWNGGGNCYRYAALFKWLAIAAGYDAQAIAGHVLTRQGTWNAHGWVEIYINGTTYVCDPQSAHAISGRNFYMITYGNAPLTYRTW